MILDAWAASALSTWWAPDEVASIRDWCASARVCYLYLLTAFARAAPSSYRGLRSTQAGTGAGRAPCTLMH